MRRGERVDRRNTHVRRSPFRPSLLRVWSCSPDDCAPQDIVFIAYLHRSDPPSSRTGSSSSSRSAAVPRQCKWTDLFTMLDQGDAVAQAGLDVDASIHADPPRHRKRQYRPRLYNNIMISTSASLTASTYRGGYFLWCASRTIGRSLRSEEYYLP